MAKSRSGRHSVTKDRSSVTMWAARYDAAVVQLEPGGGAIRSMQVRDVGDRLVELVCERVGCIMDGIEACLGWCRREEGRNKLARMIAVVQNIDRICCRIVRGPVTDIGMECQTVMARHCDRRRRRRRGTTGVGCGTAKFDLVVAKGHCVVL